MRLFLAVELSQLAQAQYATSLAAWQRTLGDATKALRWVPPANVHITLHFLGEGDASAAERVQTAIGPRLPVAPFTCRTTSLGVVPPGGPPKIVWLGTGDGASELTRLQALLSAPVRSAGFPIETRPFSPHLTVARVRDRERHSGLQAQLAALSSPPIDWTVDHVTLFRSELSGPAPRYVSMATFALV